MPETTIIVGGVAGGASCAARLRRLDETAEIILIERGPHVSFANCGLPYYVGKVIEEEQKLLVTTPEKLRAQFRLDVRVRHEVVAIDREAQSVTIRDLEADRTYTLAYDHLVLSPGASPLRPPLPGIDLPGIHTVRNVPDALRVRKAVDAREGLRAVVVGGGFIGVEMAENLHGRGCSVDLVEMAPQLMPPLDPEVAWFLQQRAEAAGVRLHLGQAVAGFARDGDNLVVTTASGTRLAADLVILAIGVRPEGGLAAAAGLELGPRGHIVVDECMRTADPRVFAVGDAVQVTDVVLERSTGVPLAGPANRQGRIAAEVIAARDSRFRGVQGTSVVGAFGLVAAATGASEKALARAGDEDWEKVRTWAGNHVGYYPGATPIGLKLLFRPSDGRVLGAQAVGEAGVEKRIDVIAMAIQMGATVHDLAEAELCYAPQFGAAKDPVNLAGMVAANVLAGDMPQRHWETVDPDSDYILDVRPLGAPAGCGDDGHPLIPLGELRDRLAEVPTDRPVLVCCNVGQTAYHATRLLRQHGIEAFDLAGGRVWREALIGAGLAR